jgi:hypothetical protein
MKALKASNCFALVSGGKLRASLAATTPVPASMGEIPGYFALYSKDVALLIQDGD